MMTYGNVNFQGQFNHLFGGIKRNEMVKLIPARHVRPSLITETKHLQ